MMTIPQENKKSSLLQHGNLHVVFSVTLMSVMGVAILTPAFPKIARELQIQGSEIGLLITVFTLPGIILTPFFGVWADRWGRKKVLIPSLFLFGLAGSACFLAGDFHQLLIFRFFQGIGGASLGSINVTIIGDLYSGKDRATAMGYNASVLSMGTALYPAIGGGLAMIAWYYPFAFFFLAIPVGLFALLGLKNPEPSGNLELKSYLSATWVSIRNVRVLGLFIASVITFVILYGSYLTFFPLLLGDRFNASPGLIGLIMSSMSLTTALTSSQLGRMTRMTSEHNLMIIAFLLYALSLTIIPFVPGFWYMILPAVLFGLAQGLNIPSIQTLLASIAPLEQRGIFMSINGMVLRLGQTLGPIVVGYFYTLGGADWAFWGGAILAVMMTFLIKSWIGKQS